MTTSVPTVQDLTTVGGVIVVVLLALRIAQPFIWPNGGQAQAKWLLLFSAVAGMIVSAFAVFVLEISIRQDIGQAILTGIFGGVAAAGLYAPSAPTTQGQDGGGG